MSKTLYGGRAPYAVPHILQRKNSGLIPDWRRQWKMLAGARTTIPEKAMSTLGAANENNSAPKEEVGTPIRKDS